MFITYLNAHIQERKRRSAHIGGLVKARAQRIPLEWKEGSRRADSKRLGTCSESFRKFLTGGSHFLSEEWREWFKAGENERCETEMKWILDSLWNELDFWAVVWDNLKFTTINLKCNQTACFGIFPLTFYVHAQSTVRFEKDWDFARQEKWRNR